MLNVAVRADWHTPWPTPTQTHLLHAVIDDRALALEGYRSWRRETDLTGTIDYATYRLLPLLQNRLRAFGVSDDFSGRCKGVYRRSWFENNLLFVRVAKVIEQLSVLGIPTMLLKGAPLAMIYYPEPATRPMSDIDLAVRAADADRAMSAVAKMPEWRRRTAVAPDLERLYKHSATFVGERMQLDLHWHCLWETRTTAANAWFWDNATPFDFQGVATLRPSATALLFSIVVHGMRCNPASPVRWVADAARILQHDAEPIDWDDLIAFATCQRLTNRLGLGLDYLRRRFGLPIPKAVPGALLGRRQSTIERLESSLYLAEPSAYNESFGQRLRRLAANLVSATDARTGYELIRALLKDPMRFPRMRRDMLRHYAAARALGVDLDVMLAD